MARSLHKQVAEGKKRILTIMLKLLIAYDGSSCSESALDDLERAGLPDVGEATVLTVAEVWLPPPSLSNDETEADPYLEELVRKHIEKGQRILNQAEMMAKHAANRVRKLLPNWTITSKATYGGPAWEILTTSDEVQPDLIVIGSNGNSVIGRFLLGSVSQKVMTEARCSVRIARGRIEVDPNGLKRKGFREATLSIKGYSRTIDETILGYGLSRRSDLGCKDSLGCS